MSEPKLIILNDAHELYVRAAEETAHIAGDRITLGQFVQTRLHMRADLGRVVDKSLFQQFNCRQR